MTQLLTRLAQFIINFPRHILVVSIIVACVSLGYAYSQLKFDSDQDSLISASQAYHQRYKQFLHDFGDQEFIFVIFEVPQDKYKDQHKHAEDFLRKLETRIKTRPDLFTDIQYRLNPDFLKRSGPYLLPMSEFNELTQNLEQTLPLVKALFFHHDVTLFFEALNKELLSASSQSLAGKTSLEKNFPLIKEIFSTLDDPGQWPDFTDSQKNEGYFYTEDGRFLIAKLLPVKDYASMGVITAPLHFLRTQVNELTATYSTIQPGITGRPVLQYDEMTSSQNGSTTAGIVALILVALLYGYFFCQIRPPLFALLALALANCWTLGWITLTLGKLNLLNMVFPIILIGLGVDYGTHFLFRFGQELSQCADRHQAILKTLLGSGQAIIIGALTSALAFFMALFTDFLGLKELGWAAGSGLIFCLIAELVVLPALLLVFTRESRVQTRTWVGLKYLFSACQSAWGPRILIGCTLLAIPWLLKTSFEHNLLKLQNPKLESVQWEQKLLNESDRSTWQAVMIADSLDELASLTAQVSQLDSVGSTSSILNLIGSEQTEKQIRLNNLNLSGPGNSFPPLPDPLPQGERGLELTYLPFPTTSLSPPLPLRERGPEGRERGLSHFEIARSQLISTLSSLQQKAFNSGQANAISELEFLLDKLEKLNLDDENFQKLNEGFFRYAGRIENQIRTVLSPELLALDSLPTEIKKMFVSDSGHFALYIEPENNIWEPDHLDKFITQLYQVDPQTTGSPIQVYESARRLQEGFYLVGLLTLIVVFAIVAWDFKSIREALVALLPVIVGLIWLLGLMGALGIKISLGNFFSFPILLGIGIDNGVHLWHRYRENQDIKATLLGAGPPIVLSSLTTCLGFGAMSLVPHPGLQSFGFIMALGSMTCLITALLIIPVFARLWSIPATPGNRG